MKPFHFIVLSLMAITLLGSVSAFSLSVDDKAMNGANSANYTDPDEKTPAYLQGDGKAGSGSSDPSSIRYDYDAASGSYVPHRAANNE